MTGRAPVEYSELAAIRGPLVVVEGIEDVGWDEVAEIRLDSGPPRHGVVLDVHRGLAVVQVYEGTSGLRLDGARVSFAGAPLRVPVGEGWLGRVCDGRGDPLDGGPPVLGATLRDVGGRPINPSSRVAPSRAIVTGVSAIDGLTTLVRGQKLPIFSVGGLPHLELAAQVASQARADEGASAIVFAAMGLTHADAATVRGTLEERTAAGELALFLNTADDPFVERLVAPRIALTVAEHLAFETDRDVLVVLADITSYAEALREISSARGELPGRRAYPGYLYSDLATLYERCGRVRGRAGSVTIVPVLTMPGGDITHPVPDLTGYITEGQVVLSPAVHSHGVYPPVDALSSLSRLMRHGAGPGRTREDHLDLAAQLLAALARAREVAELSEIVGASALSQTDQLYLAFADEFERRLLHQRPHEHRTLDETLDRCWDLAALLPRRELTMLPDRLVEQHLGPGR
jgi:V/A-type H+-transporting ATPase subunit B